MKVICLTCKQVKTHKLDIQAIENLHECLTCDSIRSDISPHLEYPGVSSQPISPEVQDKIDQGEPF